MTRKYYNCIFSISSTSVASRLVLIFTVRQRRLLCHDANTRGGKIGGYVSTIYFFFFFLEVYQPAWQHGAKFCMNSLHLE